MKHIIPNNSKNLWDVGYESDISNSIYESWNIDLQSLAGKVLASKKILPHTTETDIAGITVPTSFIYSDFDNAAGTKKYVAIANKVYLTSSFFTAFAADTLTDTPSGMSDEEIVIHGKATGTGTPDIVVLTKGTDLYRFNRDVHTANWTTNWWTGTLGQPALTSGVPHILKTFGNAPVLFILDGNKLHSVATPNSPTSSDVSNGHLKFKDGYIGNWMMATSQKIYIGLKNKKSDYLPSLFEEYDPFNETIREIEIQDGATIGFIWNNIPFIVDIKGFVKYWNGTSFEIFASFPSSYRSGNFITLPHRNGIYVIDGKILFLMPSQSTILGGVWLLDPLTRNLYHYTSPVSSKTDLVSFGDRWNNGNWGAIFGIDASADFFAGIDIVNQLSSGQVRGIFSTSPVSGTTVDLGKKRSWIITGKIRSTEISNFWRNILVKYNPNPFPSGIQSGTIKVKYRTFDYGKNFSFLAGSWVTTNKIRISESIVSKIGLGDEIFIMRGQGAGFSAHIISIDPPVSGNVDVFIDETFPVSVSGDFQFAVQNWTSFKNLDGSPIKITDNTRQSVLLDIPTASAYVGQSNVSQSEWIQFKIEIWDGLVLEGLQIGSEPSQKVEPI